MKKFGKFWEVADFKEIVTNGLNKKIIDFGAFLRRFWVKMPYFLWFLLRSNFDAYALKSLERKFVSVKFVQRHQNRRKLKCLLRFLFLNRQFSNTYS